MTPHSISNRELELINNEYYYRVSAFVGTTMPGGVSPRHYGFDSCNQSRKLMYWSHGAVSGSGYTTDFNEQSKPI